jgi:hypothetical protein
MKFAGIFKKTLIFASLIIAAVLVYASLKSPKMYVSRELVIAASPEVIFPHINNSKKSYEWMPWAEADPNVKMSYSGPEEGVGASSSWVGDEMGVGTSEVVESVPNQVVKTKLVYTEPMAMSQLAEISLTPVADGTLVKWSVGGDSDFLFRLIGIFVDFDSMVGKDFEKGLTKLKSLTENK